MPYARVLVTSMAGLALGSGCATNQSLPLIFGQSHSVGINIGGNTTEGSVDLTIGYKDRDIAIVPVVMTDANGKVTQLQASVGKGFPAGKQVSGADIDAFSVLGQFSVEAKGGGTEVSSGLGKFFATGIAARRLADAFACAMGEGQACPVEASTDDAEDENSGISGSPTIEHPVPPTSGN